MVIGELPQLHIYSGALQLEQRVLLLTVFYQLALKRWTFSRDVMLIDELQHVHNGALQLKQQQQELLSYHNHISTGVVIDELSQVHS